MDTSYEDRMRFPANISRAKEQSKEPAARR